MQFLEYVAQYYSRDELNRLAKYTKSAPPDEKDLNQDRLIMYAAWVCGSFFCISRSRSLTTVAVKVLCDGRGLWSYKRGTIP